MCSGSEFNIQNKKFVLFTLEVDERRYPKLEDGVVVRVLQCSGCGY